MILNIGKSWDIFFFGDIITITVQESRVFPSVENERNEFGCFCSCQCIRRMKGPIVFLDYYSQFRKRSHCLPMLDIGGIRECSCINPGSSVV